MPLITSEVAWDILTRAIEPLANLSLPLEHAVGAWLAEPVVADRDIPPARRAAMDGFAVRAREFDAFPIRLTVVGEVGAGDSICPALTPGQALRIFTGANVPPDADTVVPVEQTSLGSFHGQALASTVAIEKSITVGANIFLQGENAHAGSLLLDAGTRLGPRQIGLAAAVGCGNVRVGQRPRIGVLNTGEELLEPDAVADVHQIRNSNGPMLVTVLRAAGFSDVTRRTVPDNPAATVRAIREALAVADVLILTGGISAGPRDYVPQALADAGLCIGYRGIAMKPGKPQLFATDGTTRYAFGLPGNPLSAVVGLYELVLPALRLLAGCPAAACRPLLRLPLAASVRHDGDRLLVLPAVLRHDPAGTVVVPRPAVGSADVVTGALADGAILLPPAVGMLAAGTAVNYRSWGEV